MYISDLLFPVSHKRVISLHGIPQISRHSLCELRSLLNNCRFVLVILDQHHSYSGSKLITKALVTAL